MEELAKKYLSDVKIKDGKKFGTLEGDEAFENLMQDIDNTTGGFVKKWTEGPPGESSSRERCGSQPKRTRSSQ